MKFKILMLALLALVSASDSVFPQNSKPRSFPSFAALEDLSAESAARYPLRWDPSKTKWKANIEGYGQSCPLSVGDRLVVTSVVGAKKEICKVTWLDLATGKVVGEYRLDSSFPEESSPMISRAAPTPIGDEKGVYVFFESGDLVAFDLEGKLRWQRSLQRDFPKFENKFGLSSTPVQTAQHLFVLMDHAGESNLVAIDKLTGSYTWVASRGKRSNSWSSPAIVNVENEPVVVCSSAGSIDAYSPETGKCLCTYTNVGGNSVATPYDLGNGRFLISSLIRPADGPSENATISNLSARITKDGDQYSLTSEWVAKDARGSFCSPIEHRGFCYWLNPQGVLYCLDAKTGSEHFAKRVSCGACWATPFAVGDRLYLFGKEGDSSVIKIGTSYEELSGGNRIWDKGAAAEGESPRSRMAGQTLYAAIPIGNGFVFRRGDMVFRLESQ